MAWFSKKLSYFPFQNQNLFPYLYVIYLRVCGIIIVCFVLYVFGEGTIFMHICIIFLYNLAIEKKPLLIHVIIYRFFILMLNVQVGNIAVRIQKMFQKICLCRRRTLKLMEWMPFTMRWPTDSCPWTWNTKQGDWSMSAWSSRTPRKTSPWSWSVADSYWPKEDARSDWPNWSQTMAKHKKRPSLQE